MMMHMLVVSIQYRTVYFRRTDMQKKIDGCKRKDKKEIEIRRRQTRLIDIYQTFVNTVNDGAKLECNYSISSIIKLFYFGLYVVRFVASLKMTLSLTH